MPPAVWEAASDPEGACRGRPRSRDHLLGPREKVSYNVEFTWDMDYVCSVLRHIGQLSLLSGSPKGRRSWTAQRLGVCGLSTP